MNKILIKKYLLFAFIILVMGFICGIIYYYNFDSIIKNSILSSISIDTISINNILKHLLILIILLVASTFVVGSFLSIFYLFFEGLSIGFTSIVLSSKYGMNGVVYSLLYNIYSRGIFIILLILVIYKFLKLSKSIVYILFTKNNYSYKLSFLSKIKSSLLLIFIIFINDLIIYLFSSPFLNLINKIL